MMTFLFALSLIFVFSVVIAQAQNQPADYDGRWTTHPAQSQMKINPDDWRNMLLEIHTGKDENFERIQFVFSGSFVPISRVRYISPPFNSGGSDETAEITGTSFLEIAMMPAFVHESESGRETIGDRKEVTGLETVKDIRRVYAHEGQVVYVIGLDEEKRFRVQMMPKPWRLVVDVNNF